MNRLRESPGFLLPTAGFGVKLGPLAGILSLPGAKPVSPASITFEMPATANDNCYGSLNPIAGPD